MVWKFSRRAPLRRLAVSLWAALAAVSATQAAARTPVLFSAIGESLAAAVVAAPDLASTEDRGRLLKVAPAPAVPAPAELCDATAAACNYQSVMTPVRNQGRCASCWAFAALGAWEGVYALRYGAAVDLSEQQVLVCTGGGNTCSGGFWGDVLTLMSSAQISAETHSPYTGKFSKCHRDTRSQYSVASWGYVSIASVPPPVARIKQALAAHGPVIAGIYATGAFKAYAGGTFSQADDGAINHAINIVGWDDSRQAWRVRNSQGAGWGEAGYAWVAYGSNRIGTWATWVEPAAPVQLDLFGSAVNFAMLER